MSYIHPYIFCKWSSSIPKIYRVLVYCVIFTKAILYIIYKYNKYTYSAGMKERCRDGCRTSLLIAGVVLFLLFFILYFHPAIPTITIHFMEMIFTTCIYIHMSYKQSCIVNLYWNFCCIPENTAILFLFTSLPISICIFAREVAKNS